MPFIGYARVPTRDQSVDSQLDALTAVGVTKTFGLISRLGCSPAAETRSVRYFTQKEADQVRAAFLAVDQQEGYGSITDLIEAAVLREVKRLQRRHNQGRVWEPVPAGSLRPGRRTRNEERHRA